MDVFYHILPVTNTQKWVGRVESQLHLLCHQPTTGYTAQNEASIALSHTAAWSKVLPVCGASQGHKKDLVCGTVPLIAPSSFIQLSLSPRPISYYDTVNPQYISKVNLGPSSAHQLMLMKWMKDSYSIGHIGDWETAYDPEKHPHSSHCISI